MNKYESEYVNSFVVRDEPRLDWVVAKVHIKAVDFVDFLNKHKDYLKVNNGFITIDLLRAQKDRNKMYAKFTKINKSQTKDEVSKVETNDFMPDRDNAKVGEQDDLPF